MDKVLVTGANGLVGQKLVMHLTKRSDIEVIGTGRGECRIPNFTGHYFSTDLTSAEEVNALFDQIKPNSVVHTAAMTNVDQCELNHAECWANNVDSVSHLVTACERHSTFLLHFSTDFIFNGEAGPYREEDQPDPISYYGLSKLEAEKIVQKSTIPWAIGRTVLVYGIANDMSRSNIVLWVKKSLEDGKNIKVVNDQWRTPSLAEDLVVASELILDKQATGIFNLSGSDLMTPYDLAIAVADFFSLDKNLIEQVDGSIFTQPAKRPPKTGFIIDKARNVLGFEPRSFREGLALVKSQLN